MAELEYCLIFFFLYFLKLGIRSMNRLILMAKSHCLLVKDSFTDNKQTLNKITHQN